MAIFGDATGVGEAIGKASDLITLAVNKIWPNPTEAEKAKVDMLLATTNSAINELKAVNAVAELEAGSSDPWTSRARPSFLYVMYIVILFALPMGLVAAFNPTMAQSVAEGMKAWLAAIPQSMWDLFMLCFSVYAGGRTLEKIKGVA